MTQISYKNKKSGVVYSTDEKGWNAISSNPDLKNKFVKLNPAKLPAEVKKAVEKKVTETTEKETEK